MTTLTVWRYDTPFGAEAAAVRLKSLAERKVLVVHDAITIAWMQQAKEPVIGHLKHPTASSAGKGSVLGGLVGMLVLAPAGPAVSQELQHVFVTNFPSVFKVDGQVDLKGPIKTAKLASIPDIIVSPVSPKDTLRMIQGGTITMEGFGSVVLSLTGQTKGYNAAAPPESCCQRPFARKSAMPA